MTYRNKSVKRITVEYACCQCGEPATSMDPERVPEGWIYMTAMDGAMERFAEAACSTKCAIEKAGEFLAGGQKAPRVVLSLR